MYLIRWLLLKERMESKWGHKAGGAVPMYFTKVYMQRTVGDAGLGCRVRPGAQFLCILRGLIRRRVRPGAQFLCILRGFICRGPWGTQG